MRGGSVSAHPPFTSCRASVSTEPPAPQLPQLHESLLALYLAHSSCSWNLGIDNNDIGSQRVIPEPAAAASPGNLLEMHFGAPLKTYRISISGDGGQETIFNKPPRAFWCLPKSETDCLRTLLPTQLEAPHETCGHLPRLTPCQALF